MNTEPFDENEPLLGGQAIPAEVWRRPPIPEGLCETVLARTTAVVRARRHRRRVLLVAAVVAAYAGGVATARLPFHPGTQPVQEVQRAKPAPADNIRPVPQTPALLTDDTLQDPEAFALLLARSSQEKQIELLKTAGDRYLNGSGDIHQALNCYRQLLSLQLPESYARPDLNDTWLLRTLKQARLQEVHDEKTNS